MNKTGELAGIRFVLCEQWNHDRKHKWVKDTESLLLNPPMDCWSDDTKRKWRRNNLILLSLFRIDAPNSFQRDPLGNIRFTNIPHLCFNNRPLLKLIYRQLVRQGHNLSLLIPCFVSARLQLWQTQFSIGVFKPVWQHYWTGAHTHTQFDSHADDEIWLQISSFTQPQQLHHNTVKVCSESKMKPIRCDWINVSASQSHNVRAAVTD